VREKSFKSPPGTLLHQDLSLVERVLRDLAHDATQAVRIDSRMQFELLKKFGQEFTPTAVAKLEHYAGERPIFDLFNIDEEVARALSRRVDLKSGGYLIIDQTEALTTIDVNTGGFVGARNFDDTIFKTNLEAAQAIARQLRLRNLGGIIIIDFIDMTREDHQNAVLAELRKQLARDRTKITVSGFTQLGPGRDDAQAHPRVARAHAVRAVPDLRRQGPGEDRSAACATTSCARSCARRASSTRRSSA
jgi:ribonuclease G